MPREPVKFLLVDDVPENLLALEALLQRDGLEFSTARSGTEALELLLVHDFALALLDVQLPDMDGFELAELMRGTERTRRVPIIFLTAVATDERRRFQGYESGAVDYLIKPLDPNVLRCKAEVFFELDQQRRELIRQRNDLRDSEERFRRSVMQAPVPMMLFDEHRHVLVANEEWIGKSGYAADEIATLDAWVGLAHESEAPRVLSYLNEAVQTLRRARGEFDVMARDGSLRTWDLVVSPVGRTPDRRNLFLWVGHDVTARKQAERNQQLLMGELNHRVKNTLATVQAIAKQTLRHSGEPKRFAESFSGRLQALSRAHSILSAETWKGADVKDLIRDQLALGAIDEQRLAINGRTFRLEPQHSLHVALILHELATNANKYGAFSGPTGTISIAWSIDGCDFVLTWKESGGPVVLASPKRGFGTTLIEQTVKGDGGRAQVAFDTDGVKWEIRIPLRCSPFIESNERKPAAAPPPVALSASAVIDLSLKGKCFLVVEDEPLVALDLVAGLEGAGAQIAGPAGAVAEALDIIARVPLDAALLDGNLYGQPVDAVAAALVQRNVPFIFVTGYGTESLPADFRSSEILGKPFTDTQLLAAASRLIRRGAKLTSPSAAQA